MIKISHIITIMIGILFINRHHLSSFLSTKSIWFILLICWIFYWSRMEILRETSSSLILVIDACSSQPCLNGGICNATANGFTCSCSPLLTGVRCEIGIGKFCDKGNFKGHFLLIGRSSLWFHCFCATRLNDLCIILAPPSARCWPISIRLSFRSSDFTMLQTLWPLRVTCIWWLLTISSLTQISWSME